MTTVMLVLIAFAAVAYLGYLASLISGDGHGHRAASGLPRSHQPDMFETRQFH